MPANGIGFCVIDDDSVLRSLIVGILRDEGMNQLASESSGESGLKECIDKKPDLVILDINLPGTSGLDVLASLKKLEKPPLVIMITSEATAERVSAALKLGSNGFVVKPFTSAKLLTAVKLALKEKLAS
ncbi:response regulator [Chitinimonas sp.]|uniref:response regulator n=1 Tax=Chitinimonas sp. TaxID=1934313 RepID=UPI0035B3D756